MYRPENPEFAVRDRNQGGAHPHIFAAVVADSAAHPGTPTGGNSLPPTGAPASAGSAGTFDAAAGCSRRSGSSVENLHGLVVQIDGG